MSIWDKFKEKTSEDFIDDVVTEDKMKEDVSEVSAEDVEVVIDKEEAINKKLSGSASLKKYVELGRLMLALIKDSSSGIKEFILSTQLALTLD